MTFYFSKWISCTCVVLALLMLRASYWQWNRHEEKLEVIAQTKARMNQPAKELGELLRDEPTEDLAFRKAIVSGKYDYSNEIVLRNRRREGEPGVHVLTPLLWKKDAPALLVNRGFVPLAFSTREARQRFHNEPSGPVRVLLKANEPRGFLEPPDPPTGGDKPWVDAWLRVDLSNISEQIPYPLLSVYGEIIPEKLHSDDISDAIIHDSSAKEELLFLGGREQPMVGRGELEEGVRYPIPTLNTFVSAGRHLGYVYEWAIMAILTVCIGFILQLRSWRATPHREPLT